MIITRVRWRLGMGLPYFYSGKNLLKAAYDLKGLVVILFKFHLVRRG